MLFILHREIRVVVTLFTPVNISHGWKNYYLFKAVLFKETL